MLVCTYYFCYMFAFGQPRVMLGWWPHPEKRYMPPKTKPTPESYWQSTPTQDELKKYKNRGEP